MLKDSEVHAFFSSYSEPVYSNALLLRTVLLSSLPNIIEQIDTAAGMIAYCYGQKYAEMIYTIIPSKKGLKLGFYKGIELPDPDKLLQGSGKLSRYVEIQSPEQIHSVALTSLVSSALEVYKKRILK